ncbi:hypothetical protein K3G63_03155 [Hymenobacter sp. HSC-4F20]|uniref:hypothetical protein n=1 Tax=Hymenobacter sp. HSC-4F20 TaxID=2864135 RepID=UPI001C72F15C|nr:hypothetical protein [Hymenobacter sp. HSC-4F20]MBX0289416.1 hypothetical protein [Hymenobacter sp. HSC-4F20]
MTRASLLHILDHVNRISDTEVRELEQLAATFPYCQTAHVLLAKAAHDRGSMLASQRLRRAATYAADRELLRQLLEQRSLPSEVVAAPDSPEPAVAVVVSATAPPSQPVVSSVLGPAAETQPAAEEESSADVAPLSTPEAEMALAPAAPAEGLPEPAPIAAPLAEGAAASATAAPLLLPSPEAPFLDEIPAEASPTTAPHSPALLPNGTPEKPATELSAEPTEVIEATASNSALLPPTDELLPAVAPPIRPPVEAGISRFEFGFTEPELPVPSGYQLPGLEEEAELPPLASVASPQPALAPFRADEDLGYALSVGSRLGYDLQPHDGYTLDLPLDTFFEPDALLLAYVRNNQPKPATSSLDLINRFLKTQPRIKTPAGAPLPAEEQADLSARSTSVAPALASESLAKIMVKQGKKDKAIEIYERLMERQPEKKAYFAEQIQQLQQPSE